VRSNVPYDLSKEWVDNLISKHRVDFIVHGDDPCLTSTGEDAYAYAKSINRFRMFKRTEGISTTDIVGRMLLMTREHHVRGVEVASPRRTSASGAAQLSIATPRADDRDGSAESGLASPTPVPTPAPSSSSAFLPTSRRIVQFASGRAPKPDDRVVYLHGAFDLFNDGHAKLLQRARELGDFVIVGLWTDDDVNAVAGAGFPILNLYERALSYVALEWRGGF
jgi:ethanolamine-phosphate cytidylyltransferase